MKIARRRRTFTIRIGYRDDCLEIESLRGPDDAQSDLAPVGNE